MLEVKDLVLGDVSHEIISAVCETQVYILEVIGYKEIGETRILRKIKRDGVTLDFNPFAANSEACVTIGVDLSLCGWSSTQIAMYLGNLVTD